MSGGWTLAIVSALAVATLVALWRPLLALLLAGAVTVAFVASFRVHDQPLGRVRNRLSGCLRERVAWRPFLIYYTRASDLRLACTSALCRRASAVAVWLKCDVIFTMPSSRRHRFHRFR